MCMGFCVSTGFDANIFDSDSKCAHLNSINVIQYSTVFASFALPPLFSFAAIIHLLFHLQYYENIIRTYEYGMKLIQKELPYISGS
jgi:hypothetical protein